MKKLSYLEKAHISYELCDYHNVFYTFWSCAAVYFIEDSDEMKCKTACVVFPKSEDYNPTIYICEEFWNTLSLKEKIFVICHECLHIILNHGIRNGRDRFKNASHLQVNTAQDITINEMIVKMFKFNRNDVSFQDKLCWIDTVFAKSDEIDKDRNFYYYLEKIIEQNPEIKTATLDEHIEEGDAQSNSAESSFAESLKSEFNDKQEAAEVEKTLENTGNARSATGRGQQTLNATTESKKILFKNWVHKFAKSSLYEKREVKESFAFPNRRYQDFIASNKGIMLPGIEERITVKRNRYKTAIFLDVSGSCVNYAPDFRKIVNGFSKYKQIFDIECFVFDTSVTKIKITDHVHMGGGTSFHPIETVLSKMNKYPDCVIIITDGDGDRVNPLYPERWVWMMTDHHSTRYCNEKSKVIPIKDIVF